jgi:hypothetical protein
MTKPKTPAPKGRQPVSDTFNLGGNAGEVRLTYPRFANADSKAMIQEFVAMSLKKIARLPAPPQDLMIDPDDATDASNNPPTE